jgi:hypothetical protein
MTLAVAHSGRIEQHRPLSSKDPLNQIAAAWRSAYRAACRHDGMPEDTKFAVFSGGNPFVQFVDRAAQMLMDARREYAAGGYVGLSMKSGRAQ